MKLQIITDENDKIEGYLHLPLQTLQQEITKIPNNSCESIVAVKVSNRIPAQSMEGFLDLVISKLRLGGEILVSGIEQKVMAKHILNGYLKESQFNEILTFANSMETLSDTVNLLNSKGLKIKTTNMNGIEYEVSATRG
jgi:hypothetical protein|tara:strand:- start:2546 stop:2962 length:417 start_codon:yes stop_codon:yes gene_type:complete